MGQEYQDIPPPRGWSPPVEPSGQSIAPPIGSRPIGASVPPPINSTPITQHGAYHIPPPVTWTAVTETGSYVTPPPIGSHPVGQPLPPPIGAYPVGQTLSAPVGCCPVQEPLPPANPYKASWDLPDLTVSTTLLIEDSIPSGSLQSGTTTVSDNSDFYSIRPPIGGPTWQQPLSPPLGSRPVGAPLPPPIGSEPASLVASQSIAPPIGSEPSTLIASQPIKPPMGANPVTQPLPPARGWSPPVR